MGINVAWDSKDNTIIRYDLEGLWNWEDYRAAVTQSLKMMEGVNYPVGIIANFNADTMVPRAASVPRSAPAASEKMSAMPDNMEVIVITGGNAFVEVTVTGFCKLYNRVARKFLVASSVEEARQLIHQRRSTL